MTTTDPSTAYPRAARRSWLELNVRPWLAITLLTFIATLGLGVSNYTEARRDRRLIEHGTPVQATVIWLGMKDTRQLPRDEETRITLQYIDPKSGRTIESERLLHRKPGARVALKQVLKVKIDPDQPQIWTERSEPPPLLQQMTVPAVLTPIVMLSFLMTWRQRSRVRRTLARGATARATIVSIRQSALAPMSKQIGLALEGTDRTVRQTYWPASNGPIAKGDAIDIITADTGIVLPVKSYA